MTRETYDECWALMRFHAPKSIAWNHYDFAAKTDMDNVEIWKEFLRDRDVIDWLTEERVLLQDSELAKLSTDVASSRSVGQAQLISAMDKISNANKSNAATGPTFIYTYIPLNAEQKHAPNVHELTEDIFYVKPPDFKFDTNSETVPT